MIDAKQLEVKPSIHPELKEHTKHFERKVYKVTDGVYQAVGWNLANTLMIEGDDGIIVPAWLEKNSGKLPTNRSKPLCTRIFMETISTGPRRMPPKKRSKQARSKLSPTKT